MLIRFRRVRSSSERVALFVQEGTWPDRTEEIEVVASMLAKDARASLALDPRFLALLDDPDVVRVTLEVESLDLPQLGYLLANKKYSLFEERRKE